MKRVGCALLLLGVAGAVSAQTIGAYLGAAHGRFSLRATEEINGVRVTADDSAPVWKAYVGLRFLPYMAVQLDHADLGTVTGNASVATARAEARATSLSLVLYVPLANRLDLFARAGGAYSELETGITVPGMRSLSDRHTATAPTYAAGFDVRVTPHVSLRAEWERIDGGDDIDAEQWNAGVMYSF